MGTVFKKQTTAWKLGRKKVPPNTPGAEKVTIIPASEPDAKQVSSL